MNSHTNAVAHDLNRKLVLLASFLLLLGAAFAASAGTTLDRVKKSGKLTLGYISEVRPYSFKNEAGNPDGYAIDMCKAMAESAKAELGAVTLSFVPVTKEEAVRAVAQGKVDLLCTPAVPSIANRKEVSFSTPVFASGIGALVRSDVPTKLKDILSGQTPKSGPVWRANADQVVQKSTLGVMAGGRAEKELMDGLAKLKLTPKVVPVEDYAAGVAGVAAQRLDAFFGERAMLLEAAKQSKGAVKLMVLDRYFTHEVGAFAMARGDEDFRLAVDMALGKVFYSDSFASIYGKWFGPLSDRTLTLYRLGAVRD
jgi:ABC-type amino acid transport substrate-binding protein